MKKKFLYIFTTLLLVSSNMFAQWPYNEDPTCEQLYHIFVHFHLHRHSIAPYTVATTGERIVFANGNLQYNAPKPLFQLAWNQFNYIGANNASLSDTYMGWIDLFGWSTARYHESRPNDKGNRYYEPYDTARTITTTTTNIYGYGPSTDRSMTIDTTTAFREYDWGQHNFIREYSYDIFMKRLDSTMYAKRVWRIPTSAEWDFLFNNNRGVQYGANTPSDVKPYTTASIQYDDQNPTIQCKGIILFPDTFNKKKANIVDGAFQYGDMTFPTMDNTTWYRLDSVGCTFLPCAGIRDKVSVTDVQTMGYYWAADAVDGAEAKCISFTTGNLNTADKQPRYKGLSVRLIQNINEAYWKRYGH